MIFKGAVFDLDGTLLESTDVWGKIDELFLGRRGITTPADYLHRVAAMSLGEAAAYTIDRFSLREEPEAILQEWKALAIEAYANQVQPKPHALAYLQRLSALGVKLSVATGLPEALYRPVLKRLGILDSFTALCSVDDAGCGKGSPDVFLLAVKGMGLSPGDCIAFDDVPEAVRSAKQAGLTVYGMYDEASAHLRPEIEAVADGYLINFSEAPLPEHLIEGE